MKTLTKDEALELAHNYGLIVSKNKRAWVCIPEKRIVDFIDDIYFNQCHFPTGGLLRRVPQKTYSKWCEDNYHEEDMDEWHCILSQLYAQWLLGKEAM